MSSITLAASAVLLGSVLALGILLIAQRIPRWAPLPLARRIAPYVRDVADPVGLTPLVAMPVSLGWRGMRDRVVMRWGGGDALVQRLRRAGVASDVVSFRARQLAIGVGGLAVGGVLAVASVLSGRGGPITVALPPLAAAIAVVLYEQRLSRLARQRASRIEEELPTILEFLALCLAAGEGLRDALERIGKVGSGVLTAELRAAVVASGTGTNLADALLGVARTCDVPALSRSLEHVVAAMERGAPVAGVLQEQAMDAREDAKRALIEAAGRKEIAMLLPLVFMILPLSVLFAVFPGVVMLRLGIG